MASGDDWASLPSVVLQDIFSMLSFQDRLRASSTCHRWREYIFMPQFWTALSLNLNHKGRSRARFLSSKCGKFVKEVTIEFNSTRSSQVWDCSRILEVICRNGQLECLSLKPSNSFFDCCQDSFESFVEALQLVLRKNGHIYHLSLGCTESLLSCCDDLLDLLTQLHAPFLQSLHLASVKEDPLSYMTPHICVDNISSFAHLRSVSIDYDFINHQFLTGLAHRSPTSCSLKNLCINIHHVRSHPHSEILWKKVSNANPELAMTINLVQSVEGLNALLDVLKPSMPLTHLRQYFCGDISVAVINLLSYQHCTTLRSLTIVEAIEDPPINYSNQEVEDPFVMLAWRCTRLESLKLIGVSLDQKDLVAIARLRSGLYQLAIPLCCVFWNEEDEDYHDEEEALYDLQYKVSESLGQCWELLPESSLPMAVLYTNDLYDGEIDEVYMEELLQDQAWQCSS